MPAGNITSEPNLRCDAEHGKATIRHDLADRGAYRCTCRAEGSDSISRVLELTARTFEPLLKRARVELEEIIVEVVSTINAKIYSEAHA
jgi:hypothetical protein